jgi:hypothetical protein
MPNPSTWVVYERRIYKQTIGQNAVCEQSEWEEMERSQPGQQHLIKAGIATETEAERYARSGPGLGITSAVIETKKLIMHGGGRSGRK